MTKEREKKVGEQRRKMDDIRKTEEREGRKRREKEDGGKTGKMRKGR
jgi:hypothetical protein